MNYYVSLSTTKNGIHVKNRLSRCQTILEHHNFPMRALDFLGIQKFVVSTDPNESYVLLVKAQEVETFHDDEVLLKNAGSVYLPHNSLSANAVSILWKKFPNVWWVDLSNNRISSLVGKFPEALGSLNLYGNSLSKLDLLKLAGTNILRLILPSTISEDIYSFGSINSFITSILPNVWVINDDFITSADRLEANKLGTPEELQVPKEESSHLDLSNNTSLNPKTRRLIRVIQNCPPKGKYSDYFRLEILLEEYLEETCYFNCFVQQIQLQNNSSHRHLEPLPFVDMYALLTLPHRIRLDLSVVLTALLLFHIPRSLMRDALVITMGKYLSTEDIEQLYGLPVFVKTAVVCLLRRISAKEALEWSTIKQFCPKPRRPLSLAMQTQMYLKNPPAPQDYLDSNSFQFLCPVKQYLEQPIEQSITDPSQLHAAVPFSELELEILNKLPDVPTLSSAAAYFRHKAEESDSGKAMNSASYKEWIPFAARHTVLLLTKAPSCPPLTRPQQSKAKQELYFEMTPILRAANMTLGDLDLSFTGPGKDGRMLKASTALSGTSIKMKTFDVDHRNVLKTSSCTRNNALADGKSLPFGVGLPKASPVSSLSWKVQEVPRKYHKPWNKTPRAGEIINKNFTDDLESHNSGFFLTTGDAKKPSSPLASASISHYDIGAPSPLPKNRSFSTLPSPNKRPILSESLEEMLKHSDVAGILLNRSGSTPVHCQPDSAIDTASPVAAFKSLSVSVPTTNPGSPELSILSDTRAAPSAENEIDSVFTQQSLAGSEPFELLSPNINSNSAVQADEDSSLLIMKQQDETHINITTPKQFVTRPENVSGSYAKPVLGFSADANWSNKFLLAAPRAVAQSNFMTDRGVDPANYWNFIEYAPVLVHSPSKRISQESLREILVEGKPETTLRVVTAAGSRPITPAAVKTMRQPLSQSIETRTATQRHSTYEDVSIQLLKEMGTMRNMRLLQEQNAKLSALSKGTIRLPLQEDDASLSLSLSQEGSIAFGEEEEEDNMWEGADPGDVKDKSGVFLTGVLEQQSGAFPVVEEEGDAGDEDSWEDTRNNPAQCGKSSPVTPHSHVPLQSHSQQQQLQPRLSDYEPLLAAAPTGSATQRIPIPPELLANPMKELMSSVSTLDLLMRKTNYNNIHINSQSVEAGKKGINGNVGNNWYPLMAKNVYRLSSDSLDPKKLLGLRGSPLDLSASTLCNKTTALKTPTGTRKLLKPLQHSLSGTVLDGHISSKTSKQLSEPSDAAIALDDPADRELKPDLSNSTYFKALFTSHKAAKKAKLRPQPRNIRRVVSSEGDFSAFPGLADFSNSGDGMGFDEAAPASGKVLHLPPLGLELDTSNIAFGDPECSLKSTSPLMNELKLSVHNLLLSHPATPRIDDISPQPALTPPPMASVGVALKPQSASLAPSSARDRAFIGGSGGGGGRGEDTGGGGGGGSGSMRMIARGMSLTGKPSRASSGFSDFDDNVSGASSKSHLSRQLRSGGQQHNIIEAYNAEIRERSADWDAFTDSSSIAGPPAERRGRSKSPADARSGPIMRRTPPIINNNNSNNNQWSNNKTSNNKSSSSDMGVRLTPTIVSAGTPLIIGAGHQQQQTRRHSAGTNAGSEGGIPAEPLPQRASKTTTVARLGGVAPMN